jgi:two-component system, NarL family, nitrate/nitrite response regulator NarL
MSKGTDRISVFLADDHPVLREGLIRVIKANPQLELVAESGDGRAALDLVRAHRPKVALLDYGLPGLDGIEVVSAIQRDAIQTRVVLFSGWIDDDAVYRALAAGAVGIVSKTAPATELYDAIEKAARGETVVGPEYQTGLAMQVRMHHERAGPILSERERDVLRLSADGLSAAGVGERLHIGEATVRTHLAHLYEKLDVSNRAAAVAKAMRQGLLE